MKKFLLLFLTTSLLLASPLTVDKNDSYEEFEESIDISLYRQAYDSAVQTLTQNVLENFPEVELSSKSKWVSYINNFKTKNVIDFENEKIIIQTYAKNLSDARKLISERFNALLKMSIEDAYKEDFIEQSIASQMQLSATLESEKMLIADAYSTHEVRQTNEYIKSAAIKKSNFKNSNIYTMEIELPPKAVLNKAKSYKKTIAKFAYEYHLPMELIFAVIHSESNFNPLARSRTPAFGLMQIVPQTAGVDSYYFLYGKRKVLSASYLYNEDKNIKIGTTYLHLLFYRYFKDIQDPLSRLYVTVAAYNCGAGNLAKTFGGTTDMKAASAIINQMDSQTLYEYLLQNLPFAETKNYLQRVSERIYAYRTWILQSSL
jgi:membrane-bound lytic murein transglycosylase C